MNDIKEVLRMLDFNAKRDKGNFKEVLDAIALNEFDISNSRELIISSFLTFKESKQAIEERVFSFDKLNISYSSNRIIREEQRNLVKSKLLTQHSLLVTIENFFAKCLETGTLEELVKCNLTLIELEKTT